MKITLFRRLACAAAGLALSGGACAAQPSDERPAPAWRSLLGQPLKPIELSPAKRAEFEANLAAAKARFESNPDDESARIWYGRRLAYLGRFDEAIEVFSAGLERTPTSIRLLRHRGHRFISIRRFEEALTDFRAAAIEIDTQQLPDAVEEDGLPNAQNMPRSTLHGNVYYHLGVALYCTGDFRRAMGAFVLSADSSQNDDMRCASWNWVVLSGERYAAAKPSQRPFVDDHLGMIFGKVTPHMDIIENEGYHELLLFYKGELTEEQVLDPVRDDPQQFATRAYAVGAWHWIKGRPERANELWNEVVAAGSWPAFGHIAAEAELARQRTTLPAPAVQTGETAPDDGAPPVKKPVGPR